MRACRILPSSLQKPLYARMAIAPPTRPSAMTATGENALRLSAPPFWLAPLAPEDEAEEPEAVADPDAVAFDVIVPLVSASIRQHKLK